jgi:L-amino acid N-acyltransferase YncA
MNIRHANSEDGEEILRWRNDAMTREMSLCTKVVSVDEHDRWMRSRLNDAKSILFIGQEGESKVGLCRFDLDQCSECAEISIVVNPDLRGKKKAKTLLIGALNAFCTKLRTPVYARIKKRNLASLSVFTANGFKCLFNGPEYDFFLLSPPSFNPKFEIVMNCSKHVDILFRLLEQRRHTVSHETMPTFSQHKIFVASKPYREWFLVRLQSDYLGSFYLTNNNTIGLNIIQPRIDVVAHCLNRINSDFEPVEPIPSHVARSFSVNVPIGNTELHDNLIKIGLRPIQTSLSFF